MTTVQRLVKIGDEYGLNIDPELLAALGIDEHTELELEIIGRKLRVTPVRESMTDAPASQD